MSQNKDYAEMTAEERWEYHIKRYHEIEVVFYSNEIIVTYGIIGKVLNNFHNKSDFLEMWYCIKEGIKYTNFKVRTRDIKEIRLRNNVI